MTDIRVLKGDGKRAEDVTGALPQSSAPCGKRARKALAGNGLRR